MLLPCGCEIETINEDIKDYDELPSLRIDYDNINLNCPITWELLGTSKVKGCFQLDATAKPWLKKIQPKNLLELAALISLIRPGCTNAKMDDGKSMTEHYAMRKNREEPATPIHPALADILKDTYQIIVYQEQTIKIVQELAGFNLQESDVMRKAMGKKDAELMASQRDKFVEGCLKTGKTDKDSAIEIFDIIEKSNRYSFNKSHAVAYAKMGYQSAYAKVHFHIHFFTSWLKYAKYKMKNKEELRDLIFDAVSNNIDILQPILYERNKDFKIIKNQIRVGLCDVKGVGEKNVDKMLEALRGKSKETTKDIPWYELLTTYLPLLNKTSVHRLLSVGAFDYYYKNRQYLQYEYDTFQQLTVKETRLIKEFEAENLREGLDMLIVSGKVTKRRVPKVQDLLTGLDNPPFSVEDDIKWIQGQERELIGAPISRSEIGDMSHFANSTCKELVDGKTGETNLMVEIVDVREWIIKNGQNKGQTMAFLNIRDKTSSIEAVIFSNQWEQYSGVLYPDNLVYLEGNSSPKGLTINKAMEL